MSNSLQPHGLQHARLPCPSLSPWVCSNSRPLSWWCHPAIPSSVVPFSFHPQSLPASGSFLMSQLFTLGGQSTGVSVSALVLPINIQGWFSLLSKGLSRVFSSTISESLNSPALSLLCGPNLTSIHDYWENCNFDYPDLCLEIHKSILV